MDEVSVEHQAFGSRCLIQIGRAADMRKLEWYGEFTDHRQIIEQAFSAQAQGRGLVLVAAVDDFPIAQLLVRLACHEQPPRLWAFRVMQSFQNLGLGSRLLRFAEATLAQCGFDHCEIGIEKGNSAAPCLYKRMGYHLAYEQVENYAYVTPAGERRTGTADQWIFQKTLF